MPAVGAGAPATWRTNKKRQTRRNEGFVTLLHKFHQSGMSKNLHQPFGLMSPSTISQAWGGRNWAQTSQARPFLGVGWYSASCWVALVCAWTRPPAPEAEANASKASNSRRARRRFGSYKLPASLP